MLIVVVVVSVAFWSVMVFIVVLKNAEFISDCWECAICVVVLVLRLLRWCQWWREIGYDKLDVKCSVVVVK